MFFFFFFKCITDLKLHVSKVKLRIKSCRAKGHFAYSQVPMIDLKEEIIDDRFGSVVDFLFLLFKCWIINSKCSGFSCSNKSWVLSMLGMDYYHALTCCSVQHVQLHSQLREDLNQELASHAAWGPCLSLLSERRQIFLLKICISASGQQTGRITIWPHSNSCCCRRARISFVFIRVWQ